MRATIYYIIQRKYPYMSDEWEDTVNILDDAHVATELTRKMNAEKHSHYVYRVVERVVKTNDTVVYGEGSQISVVDVEAA